MHGPINDLCWCNRKRSDPDCLNDLVTVPTVDSRAGTTSVYSIEASSEFEDTMGSASRQNSSHQVEGMFKI